jgi:hypothetical protein
MSKELEAAIQSVEVCLNGSENPEHCDIRIVISAARQTLGREDDNEPFTMDDWEALRYRKNTHGEIDTLNSDTLYFHNEGGISVEGVYGGVDLTNRVLTKHEARTLIEILCGKEPTE